MQAVDSSRRGGIRQAGRMIHAAGLLVPLIFVLVAVCFAPMSDSHELDSDEGGNLMKALLVSRGHELYTEIWSDQPPVLTLVLAQWLKWFGASLAASRVLVLLFSALLLWAFYQTVRLAVSEPAALTSVALLVLSSFYVQLSISAMIGLPAIALAMLSLYLVVVAQRRGSYWLTAASGIVFGLSIQTKLFTGILVPVIAVYLCFLKEAGARPAPALGQRLGRCALWLGAMGAAFVVTGLLVGTLDPQYLITPNVGGETRTAYQARGGLARVDQMLRVHVGYLALAVVGIFWGLRRRIPAISLALGWLAVALASVLYQKPLWYHHFLLVTVPLAWLCAFGVEAGFSTAGLPSRTRWSGSSDGPRRLAQLSGMFVLGGLVVFNLVSRGLALPSELEALVSESQHIINRSIVNRLCPDGRPKPAWVFSDRPIYAFQAGLAMPPPVAVMSGKRLASAQLTEDMLLQMVRTYRPEYLVFERFYEAFDQNFIKTLGADYELLEDYYGPTPAFLFRLRPLNVGPAANSERAPARVLFDDWLSLEWTPALMDDRVEAGNCLGMPGLKWQRPAMHPGQGLGISVRLLDNGGNTLAQYDEPLGTDANTMRDRAQMPYFLNFMIPEGTPPGNYDLLLVVYDLRTGRPLEVTGTAIAAGGGVVLRQVRVDRRTEAPALGTGLADFGPVRLITADTPATAVSPGDEVPLTMLWQADADHHGESFVVVSQLLDNQRKVVAGLEEEPLNGRYGTAEWAPGELVRDHHALSIPADTPPGRYDLIVGLYRLPSRERLKTPAGLFWWRPRDYVVLRQIEVR